MIQAPSAWRAPATEFLSRRTRRRTRIREGPIQITSLEQLHAHEPEILERIAAMPNGGQLFLTNPFMLLDELGVELDDGVRAQIVELHPEIGSATETAYRALRRTASDQHVKVVLEGLFRKP
jgi:hypothetical protein